MGPHPKRSQGTFDAMFATIIDLVDESGIEAVTFRAIAAQTGFSLGTVSYQLAPLGNLRDHMWQYFEVEMISTTFGATSAENAATAVLAWARAHPNRAAFYCAHTPDPQRPLRLDVIDRIPVAPADVDVLERFRPRLRYIARRLQCVLEFAMAEEDPEVALDELAIEMRTQHRLWQAMVAIDRSSP